MTIHAVSHREPLAPGGRKQRYCGPAAISALTGRTAECAAAWINHRRGKPGHHVVVGSGGREIKDTLESLGYMPFQEYPSPHFGYRPASDKHPTFSCWLDEREHKSGLYLVMLSDHCIAVEGNKLCDSQCPDGIHVEKSGFLRRRVEAAYLIDECRMVGSDKTRRKRSEPLPPGYSPKELKAKVAKKRKVAATRRTALAKVKADPRVADVNKDYDGRYEVDLAPGYNHFDCSFFYEDNIEEVLTSLTCVEAGPGQSEREEMEQARASEMHGVAA